MRLRFFTYVKNEVTLIEEWLKHHSSLTKWYYIHVVDNGSTDGTRELLHHYKKTKGINVYDHDDYTKKGQVLSAKMKQYRNQPGILFPVDADEFVTIYQNNKIIKSPTLVSEYLKSLPTHCGSYNTKGTLFSIPEKYECKNPFSEITKWEWRWNTQKMCKKFYVNQTFKSTDHGNHNGITDNNNHYNTDVTLLHYHNIGYESYKFRCEQDIRSLGIKLDVIKQQLAAPGCTKGTNMVFAGREKVNSYLNIKNWKYVPADKYDVEYCWSVDEN